MTDEQIKKLAKEYTEDALEDWCTENGQFVEPWHCVVADLSFIAAKAIQNISKTHCIVEKSRIQKFFKVNQGGILSGAMTDNVDLVEYSKGRNSQLKDLFGKELFNGKEE